MPGSGRPATCAPVTVRVPVIAWGWMSQKNLNVPGLSRVMVALLPAKRPFSGPGGTMPVVNDPSSAEIECGLPPALAKSSVVPACTSTAGGSKRSFSPWMLASSSAWTRWTLAFVGSASTMIVPFIFTGLMRQK